MNKAELRKVVKGVGILLLDKVVAPLARLLIGGFCVVVMVFVIFAIGDTIYYAIAKNHVSWLTQSDLNISYACLLIFVLLFAWNIYKSRNSYFDHFKKVADDHEQNKIKKAKVVTARKRLADKGAYVDEKKNTK